MNFTPEIGSCLCFSSRLIMILRCSWLGRYREIPSPTLVTSCWRERVSFSHILMHEGKYFAQAHRQ